MIKIFILLLVLFSCNGNKEKVQEEIKTLEIPIHINKDSLRIVFSPIKDGKFEQKIFDKFSKEYDCKIDLVNMEKETFFQDSLSIFNLPFTKSDSIDIYLGFNQEETILKTYKDYLQELPDSLLKLSDKKYRSKRQKYFIPVATEYLLFIYNKKMVDIDFSNFGQFQDERLKSFFILPNPEKSVIGKYFLYWLGLTFGNGVSHFCKSITKSIYSIEDSREKAIAAFTSGNAQILLCTSSEAFDIARKYEIGMVIPTESSFGILYQAGINKKSKKQKLSNLFLEFFITQNKIFEQHNICNTQEGMFIKNKEKLPLMTNDLSKKISVEDYSTKYELWRKKWKKVLRRFLSE